jgi:hypothetical protein
LSITRHKPKIVRPRAFYVRAATGAFGIFAVYYLMAYDFMTLLNFFGLSEGYTGVVTMIIASLLVAVTTRFAVDAVSDWCLDTVYVIAGSMRFHGRQGMHVPAGVQVFSGEGKDYITVEQAVVGKSGFVDVPVCFKLVK